jgi:hypothetical protein
MHIGHRWRKKTRPGGGEPAMSQLTNEKHLPNLLKGFSEAFVTGKFCDVKVVCEVRRGDCFKKYLCCRFADPGSGAFLVLESRIDFYQISDPQLIFQRA